MPLVSHLLSSDFEVKSYDDRSVDFIFVGNLEERKNPLLFLQSCKALNDKLPHKLNISLVGSGELEYKCKEFIEKSGLNVVFHGSVQPSEVLRLMSEAKFFVFPSSLDAWGLVVNEALTVGTPVLSSKFAASTFDLIENNSTGFVIEDLSETSLSNLLEKAITMPESHWTKISQNAVMKVSDYSVKNAAYALSQVFK